MDHTYIAIDLKSFYASVECMERGLDPLTTNLVVADASRTEKTICLAVSPSLKAYGIPGRARLFEVIERLRRVNAERRLAAGGRLSGESYDDTELKAHPEIAVGYLAAVPRMAHYMEYSSRIYQIYLKYISPEDIHVYSIDEVFIDATAYLSFYHTTPRALAMKLVSEVREATGITATAGIGTNLYLAKIAMDIMAKHVEADEYGVRIAELDEMIYRKNLWTHRPLTDFWRVGRGYARKLEENGLYTMGDIARCSVGQPGEYYNEDLLYRLFGINAELLIDHAWGWEPCTIAQVKAYEPDDHSFSSGQVLTGPYPFAQARVVVEEMADEAAMGLLEKGLVTSQVTLTVGYDIENLKDPERRRAYKGPVTKDWYGRQIPKPAHGTANLNAPTSSARLIREAVLSVYDRTVDPALLVRRMYVNVNKVVPEAEAKKASEETYEQLDLFTDYAAEEEKRAKEAEALEKERRVQEALLAIRQKYGKNAVVRGVSFEEGATGRERHGQIGGHKA